jgi:hypothetical protein
LATKVVLQRRGSGVDGNAHPLAHRRGSAGKPLAVRRRHHTRRWLKMGGSEA